MKLIASNVLLYPRYTSVSGSTETMAIMDAHTTMRHHKKNDAYGEKVKMLKQEKIKINNSMRVL